jgi:hypothetical protein
LFFLPPAIEFLPPAYIPTASKGISTLIEKNVKKVSDLDKIKKVSKSNKIPVVSIGSTISPVYSTSSWLCLHQEDDLLVSRSCSNVNEVVFDHDLIQKSLTYCKEATLGYLLANLYDTIFAYSYTFCLNLTPINKTTDKYGNTISNGNENTISKKPFLINPKSFQNYFISINKDNKDITQDFKIIAFISPFTLDKYFSSILVTMATFIGILIKIIDI